jgi:hypothetical protein
LRDNDLGRNHEIHETRNDKKYTKDKDHFFTTMASTTTPVADYHLHHPQLGELVGMTRGDDIVQFRGIPFAEIPGRFRQAKLLGQLPQSPFDARQPGYVRPNIAASLGVSDAYKQD